MTVPVSEALLDQEPAQGTCLKCGVLLDHTEAVRIQLHDLAGPRLAAEAERERLMDQTTPLIRAAHDLGVMPTELERLTGLSRRTIYNLLAKQ